MADFKDRLRQKRLKAGLSQKALANEIGISITAIQKYESGASTPKGTHLVSLGKVLDCSIDWLMTGEKNHISIDKGLLENILYGVESWLDEKDLELDSNSKSELIALLYDQFVSDSGQYDSGTLERFMHLGTK